MAAQPPDPEIEKLLAELRSDEADRRKAAAEEISKRKLKNNDIRKALKNIADKDPDWQAKSAAHNALRSFRDPKRDRFWIGFFGWFVAISLVGGLVTWLGSALNPTAQNAVTIVSSLLLLLNLVALIVLALLPNWRWAALGMLAALAVAFVGVLILGLLFLAVCFSRPIY